MKLINKSVIKTLESLAEQYEGDFSCSFGMATLQMENKSGSGTIKAFETYSGLSSIVYDITFHEDVFFERSLFSMNPIYCLYSLEGHMFHKFEGDEEFERLDPYHSFILAGSNRKLDITGFPAGVPLKIAAVFLVGDENTDTSLRYPIRTDFKNHVNSIKEKITFSDQVTISPKTSLYVKNLMENKETGVVGRLFSESAILGILASQFQSFSDALENSLKHKLSSTTYRRILKVARYIEKNLGDDLSISKLTSVINMDKKQLQQGFKFLFDVTVNNFTTNVRLERSRELIETTDLTISEIVFRIGLNNRSHFSKIFSEKYGLTPSNYKKLGQENSKVYEVSYLSKSRKNLDDKEINQLIGESRKNNEDFNLTGCLVYDFTNFIQILEGDKTNVLKIFERIKNDERHTDIQITWQGYREIRKFNDWNMALICTKKDKSFINNVDARIEYLLTDDLNIASNSHKFWDKIKKELVL